MQIDTVDIIQDYEWDDISGKGKYQFGKDGYFVMDGSSGPIRCRRDLLKPIASPYSAIEFIMRFVLGSAYAIHFLNNNEKPILICKINENGQIIGSTPQEKDETETGYYLNYHNGIPFATQPKSYTVLSDEHIFKFDQWDLKKGQCCFSIDNSSPIKLACLKQEDNSFLKSVELLTLSEEGRPRIYLKNYREYFMNRLIENDSITINWESMPAPEWDEPYDNLSDTEVRPKGNHWLEVGTGYGYVKAKFPNIVKGSVEFDLMAEDIDQENCFLLEEASGVVKDAVLMVGIYKKRFIFTTEMPPNFTDFLFLDDFEEPVPGKSYHFKIVWDCRMRSICIYINGMLQRFGGKTRVKMMIPPRRGVDTITIHTGYYGTRLSRIEHENGKKKANKPFHLSYWGAFRIQEQLST